MNRLAVLSFTVLLVLVGVVGCVDTRSSTSQSLEKLKGEQLTIFKAMKDKGIVCSENITKIVIKGDESSYTQGKTVIITDKETIRKIFSHFKPGTPYDKWRPAGDRRFEIYTKISEKPTLKLRVNGTDRCTIDGLETGFLCNGLEEAISSLLRGG